MTWFIAAACARNEDHTTITQRLADAEAVRDRNLVDVVWGASKGMM
jgi:hypothetical protein